VSTFDIALLKECRVLLRPGYKHGTPIRVDDVAAARAINMALLSECPRHPVRGVIFIEDGAKENLHSFRSAMLTT